jgi:hypothetical protein
MVVGNTPLKRAEQIMGLIHFRKHAVVIQRHMLACVLLGTMVGLHPQEGVAQGQEAVRLSLAVEKPSFVLYAPVYAVLMVQNGLPEPIEVSFGIDGKSDLELVVTPPGGKPLNVSYPFPGGIGILSWKTVQPRQTYTQRLLLSEWYDFAASGPHSIQLQSRATMRTVDGRTVQPVPADKIVVQVGLRDDEDLRRVCGELATQSITGRTVQQRVDAALALSLVRHIVAIPFLAQVLEHGVSVEEYAIQGLGRIGTREATDILIASLSTSDATTKRLATRELRKISERTADQQLRTHIQSTLKP